MPGAMQAGYMMWGAWHGETARNVARAWGWRGMRRVACGVRCNAAQAQEARHFQTKKHNEGRGFAVNCKNAMDENEVEQWVRGLIKRGGLHEFYNSVPWKALAAEVIAENKNECRRCKACKRYARATVAHHKKYVRSHPRLALTKSNIEPLCAQCHYTEHHKLKPQLNAERW